MSPIDPYLGAQAPTQDFIRTFLDREIPAGLLFYAPFWPQTGNQAWAADKRIVVPTTETVDADGSYFAKDGLIRRARANALRMEGLGGLIEGARTNLQIRSEEFNLIWLKDDLTIFVDDTAAPDGAITADRATETVIDSFHYMRDDITQVNGQPYASTVYVKRGAIRDWIFLYGDEATAQAIAWFNINTGVVGTVAGTSAPWAAIERLPNGWFRCTLGWTAAAGGLRFHGHGLTTADGVIVPYPGSTSAYCWFWGSQVENGTFATSYIPTVAAAVVRAQENIQYASAGHIEAAAGTLFVAVTPEADTDDLLVDGQLIDTRVAGNANGFTVYQRALTNQISFFVRSGGAVAASIDSGITLTRGQTYIVTVVWQINEFRLYQDGVLLGSDLAGAAPAALNASMFIGQTNALGTLAYSDLAHLAIYNRVMSAPEIEQRSHFFRNQMARAS